MRGVLLQLPILFTWLGA